MWRRNVCWLIINCHNKINRAKLNASEIEKEMAAIAKTGLQEILILTGESKKMSDIEYIGEACKIARKYFKVIGLEVYPMNSDEYAYLHECGADYVTVFQETYNSDKYETLHLAGHKRIFPYRVNAQERALKGGMRGVGFAALLGLDDFRKDALATGYHAYLLQKKYPRAEIAFSCPRLCPIINNDRINPKDVHETQLLQVVCAYRLFMPFASITISTREVARVRDNLVNIAATKISAGVSTGIGSHVDDIEDKGDDQFEISDGRSVDEVFNALLDNGLQPATEPGPDGVRVCEKTMQIEDGKAIDVKIIVDHDMIEAFIDEQIAFTYRIYAKPEFETGIIAQDSNVEFYNLSISGK